MSYMRVLCILYYVYKVSFCTLKGLQNDNFWQVYVCFLKLKSLRQNFYTRLLSCFYFKILKYTYKYISCCILYVTCKPLPRPRY